MPGGAWSEMMSARKAPGKPHSEYKATQRWVAARKLRGQGGHGDSRPLRPYPANTVEHMREKRAKSARAAARRAERRELVSRGSSVSSRPVTAPSEPGLSRPSTSESAKRRPETASAAGATRELPEPEPELRVPAPPPSRHPEVIRLHRRPKNGRAKNVKIFANGNRMELLRAGSDDDDDDGWATHPEPSPPVEEPAPPIEHGRYRCVAEPGAVARAGLEFTSEKTGYVFTDEVVAALEHGISSTGVRRVRCKRGWVSLVASNGQPVLEPTEDRLRSDSDSSDGGDDVLPARPRDGPYGSPRSSRPRSDRQRVKRTTVDVDVEDDKPYPRMPVSTLGMSAETQRLKKQREDMLRASPPSSHQSVSNVARTGGAPRGEWAGSVVKAATWQRRMRKQKHRNPDSGKPTGVRPAVGLGASEVEGEEDRLRGSIMLFDAATQGSKNRAQNLMWVRKGHINSKPVDSSGADAVGGRVGIEYRHTAWQSPVLYMQKLEDMVEEAEEESRMRARAKARQILQAQMERQAARMIWVKGEQVELPPTPPPTRPWDESPRHQQAADMWTPQQ
jgi:hypothetical protein